MKPYYDDGRAVIYHGDCRDVLPSLRADVLITDPPYGVNLGRHDAAFDKREKHLHKRGYVSYDDSDENLRGIVVPAVELALFHCGGRGVVFVAGSKIGAFPEPSAVGGVYLPSGTGRNAWGFQNLALCLFYGQAPDVQKGCRPTVIRSNDHAETNGHPVPKPLKWMTWMMSLASRMNETVLDPFMGSGTTLVAAKAAGRHSIGIEIEERYCEIAAKRLSQETLGLSV